ncbi:MAG: phage integrase N-terminal SAM-like domain-containing protein [Bacteroidetes bacterium]|nr:phage integrase N-terminal SAM-like domain-containing protein [Bacteroidota bacterium]
MGLLMGKVKFLDKVSAEEIKAFINNLANNHRVSSSTKNQALQIILFLYTIPLYYFKDMLLNWLEKILTCPLTGGINSRIDL